MAPPDAPAPAGARTGSMGFSRGGGDAAAGACRVMARHASTVAFGARCGIAITGPAGAGKSTLAMALIAQGARLVADDRSLVWPQDGALYARAPRPIAGLLERRGLGLLRLGHLRLVRLRLVIDLGRTETRRLPPQETVTWQGITLPCLAKPTTAGALAAGFPAALRHYIKGRWDDGDGYA